MYFFETITDSFFFKNYCAELLHVNGYVNISVTQTSGDSGIDILAEKDGISYAIQCKLSPSPVGISSVQEAFSGRQHYNRDIAVVMTNNLFAESAKELARSSGVKLWNKFKLGELEKNGERLRRIRNNTPTYSDNQTKNFEQEVNRINTNLSGIDQEINELDSMVDQYTARQNNTSSFDKSNRSTATHKKGVFLFFAIFCVIGFIAMLSTCITEKNPKYITGCIIYGIGAPILFTLFIKSKKT